MSLFICWPKAINFPLRLGEYLYYLLHLKRYRRKISPESIIPFDLFGLPLELIERILNLISFIDLISISRTGKKIHTIVENLITERITSFKYNNNGFYDGRDYYKCILTDNNYKYRNSDFIIQQRLNDNTILCITNYLGVYTFLWNYTFLEDNDSFIQRKELISCLVQLLICCNRVSQRMRYLRIYENKNFINGIVATRDYSFYVYEGIENPIPYIIVQMGMIKEREGTCLFLTVKGELYELSLKSPFLLDFNPKFIRNKVRKLICNDTNDYILNENGKIEPESNSSLLTINIIDIACTNMNFYCIDSNGILYDSSMKILYPELRFIRFISSLLIQSTDNKIFQIKLEESEINYEWSHHQILYNDNRKKLIFDGKGYKNIDL